MNVNIKFKIEQDEDTPLFHSKYAAGFDIRAKNIMKIFKGDKEVSKEKVEIINKGFLENGYIKFRPFERIMFNTGLTIADIIIEGFGTSELVELQVRSRSGIVLKKGLIVANQPGTIDQDYRGIVGVILYNTSPFLVKLERNERIAQIVPSLIPSSSIESSVDMLITQTDRGEKGFGSTGTK